MFSCFFLCFCFPCFDISHSGKYLTLTFNHLDWKGKWVRMMHCTSCHEFIAESKVENAGVRWRWRGGGWHHSSSLVYMWIITLQILNVTVRVIVHFHWHHAVLQHDRWIAQTDLDIHGSHAHHMRTRSSCAWTTNGEVHGETVTHDKM